MAFDSWQAFWTMGGHGPYVWSCYAVFLIFLVGLVAGSIGQRRQVIRRQRWQQRLAKRHNAMNRGSEKSTA